MEESINEIQTTEKQLLQFQQWMVEVTKEIQNRLDADVLAGDVPEEHEVTMELWDMYTFMSKGVFHRPEGEGFRKY